MRGWTALLGSLLLASVGSPPLEYRFDEVKSKVTILHDGGERKAAAGDIGYAGDGVRTGWRGRAVVAVPERASRFEIFPSSHVTLAGPDPGVLIVIERGRLKAIFNALTGDEERLVATPGALLAVRGTRYGVEVDRYGNAAVAVFEGTVEIRSRIEGLPPLALRAGEQCRFSPRRPPERIVTPGEVREDTWRGGLAAPQSRRLPDATSGQGAPTSPGQQPPQQRPGSRGGAGRPPG